MARSHSPRLLAYLSAVAALSLGCSKSASTTSKLTIAVAPLNLPGLSQVCYDLAVTNAPNGAGQPVWSRGTPGLSGSSADADAICSSAFGNGSGGAVTFVGACDASAQEDPADLAGERTNSVTLWVDGLYDSTGIYLAPDGPNGWQNPCPSGCTLNALCEENADTKVEFNLTILRQANQGFFDIAVTFEDIFCSAKVDCVGDDGEALKLLFNPATGLRDTTVVSALACTAGPGSTLETVLFRDPVKVTCGPQATTLDPAAGKGNAYTSANPDPNAADAIWQYAIYASGETLSCAGQPCNKRYWNVAIGLDPQADNCVLTTRMTAAPKGTFDYFDTPPGTTYPVIAVNVPLTYTTGLICTTHPLNALNSGVKTEYTPVQTPETFSYAFDTQSFTEEIPICNPACGAHGTCTARNVCTCAAGWSGSTCATPICTSNCQNGGTCTTPNTCTCTADWTGATCQTPVCDPACSHGQCTAPDTCSCDTGWDGATCGSAICASTCQNGGTCSAPDTCSCPSTHTGSPCQTPVCNPGCANGGTCSAPNTCSCPSGWSGATCNVPVCSAPCQNGGTCAGPNTCACTTGWGGADCGTSIGPTMTDTDALAYVTSASIADTTQQNAIHNLVYRLKNAGLWTKMKCIFPFLGGTSVTHSWNLRNTGTCRLTFTGTWTHDANGATPDGSTAYATFPQDMRTDAGYGHNSAANQNAHLSFYTTSQTDDTTNRIDMGGYESGSIRFYLSARRGPSYSLNTEFSYNGTTSKPNYGTAGYYLASKVAGSAGTFKTFKNGSLWTTGNLGTSSPAWPHLQSYAIGAVLLSSGSVVPQERSNRSFQFATMGYGLTDAEAASLTTIVESFEAEVGPHRVAYKVHSDVDAMMRDENSGVASIATAADNLAVSLVNSGRWALLTDADARRFILRANLTETSRQDAIQGLVAGLKTDGLWSRLQAVYPFVGGTEASHALNLVAPTSTSFRLAFSGTWVHSATGSKPDGLTAKANTSYDSRNSPVSKTNVHLGIYTRSTTSATPTGIDMGNSECWTSWYVSSYFQGGGQAYPTARAVTGQTTLTPPSVANPVLTGFFINNRTSTAGNAFQLFANGTAVATGTSTEVNPPGFSTVHISAIPIINGYGCSAPNTFYNYSDREVAFATIGGGMTAVEAANYTARVATFQQVLGRTP